MEEERAAAFDGFVADVEPRLRRALVAKLGFERGADATAEALGWAWEHWDRAAGLEYPVAYLFRVGQSRTRPRRQRRLFEYAVCDLLCIQNPGIVGQRA